jgi:hypothetical protein
MSAQGGMQLQCTTGALPAHGAPAIVATGYRYPTPPAISGSTPTPLQGGPAVSIGVMSASVSSLLFPQG